MKPSSLSRPLLVSFFIAAGLQPLCAVSVWTNSGTTDWFTASNWFGGIPTTTNSETQMVNGTIVISRTDAGQAVSNSIWVGGNGPGSVGTASLSITNGASLATTFSYIGINNGSNGTLNVSGTGSTFTNSSQLYVGLGNGSGNAVMNITPGSLGHRRRLSSHRLFQRHRLRERLRHRLHPAGQRWHEFTRLSRRQRHADRIEWRHRQVRLLRQ